MPYLVHHTIFSNPNSSAIGYDVLQKQIAKEYNYIYTGKNVDVLKFDIQINNLFFTGNNPKPESQSAQVSNPDQQGPAPVPGKKVTTGRGNSPQVQLSNTGRRRLMKDPTALKKTTTGGADTSSTEQKVAEAFHKSFITGSSADLVTVDLEVTGDTFWLVDSGQANYFAKPSAATPQITDDGTANYEGSDCYIFIRFQNPQDVDMVSGLYRFPNSGKTSPFTGIYKVTLVESTFNDGFFKQKLKCIRMPLQTSDLEGLSTARVDKAQALASDVQERIPQPSSLNAPPQPEVTFDPPPPVPVQKEIVALTSRSKSLVDFIRGQAQSVTQRLPAGFGTVSTPRFGADDIAFRED